MTISLRIQKPADRNNHRFIIDVLAFRIVSIVDQLDLTAASGSADRLVDPSPDASGPSRQRQDLLSTL
jgi:hypothetical protein